MDDIAQLNPEIGGSISFMGKNLIVNKSIFLNGTGFRGGSIYISSLFYYSFNKIQQNVVIVESLFLRNRGNFGGAVFFSKYCIWIDILFIFCIFTENKAFSKKYIFQ